MDPGFARASSPVETVADPRTGLPTTRRHSQTSRPGTARSAVSARSHHSNVPVSQQYAHTGPVHTYETGPGDLRHSTVGSGVAQSLHNEEHQFLHPSATTAASHIHTTGQGTGLYSAHAAPSPLRSPPADTVLGHSRRSSSHHSRRRSSSAVGVQEGEHIQQLTEQQLAQLQQETLAQEQHNLANSVVEAAVVERSQSGGSKKSRRNSSGKKSRNGQTPTNRPASGSRSHHDATHQPTLLERVKSVMSAAPSQHDHVSAAKSASHRPGTGHSHHSHRSNSHHHTTTAAMAAEGILPNMSASQAGIAYDGTGSELADRQHGMADLRNFKGFLDVEFDRLLVDATDSELMQVVLLVTNFRQELAAECESQLRRLHESVAYQREERDRHLTEAKRHDIEAKRHSTESKRLKRHAADLAVQMHDKGQRMASISRRLNHLRQDL